jgi:patatin-like phospholipase/acyl hydrolase
MALTHIPHLTISPYTALTPTQVNNNPPQAKVWRNYNYPPGQRSRYPGAFRINTVTAVRATSAAPTFFTPVQWEKGLYCDGALVANNPTAIALQEAKVRGKGIGCTVISFNGYHTD